MTDKKTILIVEDDLDIADTLKDVLSDAGYAVACTENGQQAIDYLLTQPPPDLILLDLMMPLMDGRQFRRQQLQHPHLAEIPVVVLTASRDLEKVSELAVAGWVKKPFNLWEFLQLVHRFTEPQPAQAG